MGLHGSSALVYLVQHPGLIWSYQDLFLMPVGLS